MDITKFNEKFNKLDGNIYTVEETVTPVNGVYEAELEHDNINQTTLNVYTGSKLTGDKINTYVTSTPSLTPWKTVIKIYSNVNKLYISYETTGDEVEADDINNVQDAIVDTQKALNDEITRSENAEKVLTDNLSNEINRANGAENSITNNLNVEIYRAKGAEKDLTDSLSTTNNNLNNEINRASNAENSITNTINSNKPIWDDKYTKNEVDNKLNVLVTNLDWKESVATYSDIVKNYQNPDDGWTVNVKDTDITYRYSGTSWIPISANSIPLATKDVDGKMSKQDKIDHDDMVSKRHTHSNKGVLDVITQSLIDTWNVAYSHISDAVKHITSAERSLWNTVSNKLDKNGGIMTGSITVSDLGSKDVPAIIINGPNVGGGTSVAERYINYKFDNAGITRVGAYRGGSWDNYFKVQTTVSGPSDFVDVLVAGNNVFTYKGNKVYHVGDKPTPADIGASAKGHTHDDRYYTETECDAKYATKDQISKAGYGDMLKSTYDTDGDGVVNRAESIKCYITTNSVGSYQGYYTKIASVNITSQYANANLIAELCSSGAANYTQTKGSLHFKVKQQDGLGAQPGIDLKIHDNEVISASNFVAVITSNTTSATNVELYYKAVQTWDALQIIPILNENFIFYNNQPYINSLPSGTQIACSYTKKALTWNDLEGV